MWAKWWWQRCRAVKEPNNSGYWGRCERRKGHRGHHALERGFEILSWHTAWTHFEYLCDCTVHNITTPGAAHANDCPMYD